MFPPAFSRPCGRPRLLRRISCAALAPFFLVAFCAGLSPLARAQFTPVKPGNSQETSATLDHDAVQRLQQMADAYTHLRALDQETEFFSRMIPLTPNGEPASPAPTESDSDSTPARSGRKPGEEVKLPQTLHLVFAQANRFTLDSIDTAENGTSRSSRWVCDGKTFWTYSPSQNWYTEDKAPAHMRDFIHVSNMNINSLEILMLMGVNIFAELQKQVDSIRSAGTATVRGVPTDEIVLHTTTATEITELQFYIGKDDNLLHRLIVETSPVPKTQPHATGLAKAGDALDELIDETPNHSTPQPPDSASGGNSGQIKTSMRYDNIIHPNPVIAEHAFLFTIPPGALLHLPPDRTGKRAQKMLDARIASILKDMNHGKSSKHHRIIY